MGGLTVMPLLGLFFFFLFAFPLLASADKPFVFNGTAAQPNQFKFIVGIYVNDSSICTGFIINENYIGTAAHCFPSNYQNSSFNVLTFENDTDLFENPRSTIKAHVLTVHPKFSLKTLVYDIAILRLLKPLTLGEENNVLAIPLASSLPDEGAFVHNAGYGDTADDFNNYTLNYITVPYMSAGKCQAFYPNNSFTTTICAAGYEGKSSCFGDSGGPLFTATDVTNPTDAQVIGITSYGKACGSTIPVVYTSIPTFGKAWFEEQIHQASYCPGDCRKDYKKCLGNRRTCRKTRQACLSKCTII
jgi:secreted trypsin-like serine protease